MSFRRLPVAALLAVLVAASFLVDARGLLPAANYDPPAVAMLGPVVAGDDAGASSWFCAGGGIAAGGLASHLVTVANPGAQEASGTVTVFVEGREPQRFPLSVPAHDRRQLRLSDLVGNDDGNAGDATADDAADDAGDAAGEGAGQWAAAMVELDRGGIAVSHAVVGSAGGDGDRCHTRSSGEWYLPWGRTTPQEESSLRLALFNPFPVESVVDITFDTPEGYRAPEAVQGLLVPARRLVTVELTSVVPVRDRISTSIVARSGRLVVDAVQTLTGADGVSALDVTPAAPATAAAWYFPQGWVQDGTVERIAVYNPGNEVAEIEVAVQRSRSTQELPIEPFELTVPAGSYGEIVLNDEGRVPTPLRHSTVVRSRNGVGVVAASVTAEGATLAAFGLAAPTGGAGDGESVPVAPSGRSGLTVTLGSPVVASSWVVPAIGGVAAGDGKVAVLNPSADTSVTMTIEAWSDASATTVPLPASLATLEPGQQVEIAIEAGGDDPPVLLVVVATGPVVVGASQTVWAERDQWLALPRASDATLFVAGGAGTPGGG